MTITMYGIKNCDTVKKARAWLDARGVDYRFHDYKTAGVDRNELERWCEEVGWERLVNRSGMTFRKLPEKQKQSLSRDTALALMVAQPSVIKRPVLVTGGPLLVGFSAEAYESLSGRR
ncbi:MAG: ArsC family reductase [Rhodospirillaceae bacterium]